jgi:hypothetical protein
VQLSIWPGGASTNAKGTIDWAGGPIDWNSAEIKNYGYYFATFGQIEVECYNATTAPGTNLHKSYTYNNVLALNNSIVDGDKDTVLKSFLGTGTNMNAGASGVSSGSASSATANTVPGGTASGPGAVQNGNSGSSGSSSGTTTASAATCTNTGFSQDGCGSTSSGSTSGTSSSDGPRGVERTLGASAFAVVVGFAALLCL